MSMRYLLVRLPVNQFDNGLIHLIPAYSETQSLSNDYVWHINRGSYTSAHVLLNLSNELEKAINARFAEHFIAFS